MAHSLDVLSKTFLNKNEIISKMRIISQKQGNNFSIEEDNRVDIWKAESYTLEIHFLTQDKFSELKEDDFWGKEYAVLFYITIYGIDDTEDRVTFPFLRELLKDYPDLLVFNEEIGGGKPFVYNKMHLDAFSGNSFAGIFAKPPQDLSNLA